MDEEHWCPSKLCSNCKRHDKCYPQNWSHTGIVEKYTVIRRFRDGGD